MEMNTYKTISRHKFEDSIQNMNVIPMGHFILFLCFVFPLGINFRAIICLLTVLSFLVLRKFYNWQSSKINFLLIGIYLAVLIGEIWILGIPTSLQVSAKTDFEIALIGELLSFLPIIYIGLRFIFLVPLLSLFISGIGVEYSPPKEKGKKIVDERILDSSFN